MEEPRNKGTGHIIDNSSAVENLYDAVSKEYAEVFSGEHGKKPMDREILLRFSQAVKNRKPVWDFGCGPGHTAKCLKKLGVEIAGLDLSARFVEHAQTTYPDIPFRKGNMLALEFDDNSIAAIIAFYAIVHFTEDQVRTALNEIYRVLKPGGLLLLSYHIGEGTLFVDEFLGKKIAIEFMFFKPDQITNLLTMCGFSETETIERDPYPEIEYQSRRAYVFAGKPSQ